MNGHWLINLNNDDQFDYSSNGASNQIGQKNDILSQNHQ